MLTDIKIMSAAEAKERAKIPYLDIDILKLIKEKIERAVSDRQMNTTFEVKGYLSTEIKEYLLKLGYTLSDPIEKYDKICKYVLIWN